MALDFSAYLASTQSQQPLASFAEPPAETLYGHVTKALHHFNLYHAANRAGNTAKAKKHAAAFHHHFGAAKAIRTRKKVSASQSRRFLRGFGASPH
jgi:hypothetical protein